MISLENRLAQGEIILMDGATGTELERRGVPMNDKAWSVAAVHTHPAVVRQIHEDYIRIGADIIITNTFSTSRHVLEEAGLSHLFQTLNAEAVTVARQARDAAADRPVFIAGSISTSVFFRHQPPQDIAKANFEAQADILAEAEVDLIILEMMRDIDYTRIALHAAERTGLPIWIGFSSYLDQTGSINLHRGEDSLAAGVKAIVEGNQSFSLMAIMHTLTEDTRPSLEVVKDHWSGPIGAYAHSGQFVMPNWQFINMISPEDYAAEALKWVDMGVQVIGGCCGIGPEHIQVLKEQLPKNRPNI